jgi:hypothetical protein
MVATIEDSICVLCDALNINSYMEDLEICTEEWECQKGCKMPSGNDPCPINYNGINARLNEFVKN